MMSKAKRGKVQSDNSKSGQGRSAGRTRKHPTDSNTIRTRENKIAERLQKDDNIAGSKSTYLTDLDQKRDNFDIAITNRSRTAASKNKRARLDDNRGRDLSPRGGRGFNVRKRNGKAPEKAPNDIQESQKPRGERIESREEASTDELGAWTPRSKHAFPYFPQRQAIQETGRDHQNQPEAQQGTLPDDLAGKTDKTNETDESEGDSDFWGSRWIKSTHKTKCMTNTDDFYESKGDWGSTGSTPPKHRGGKLETHNISEDEGVKSIGNKCKFGFHDHKRDFEFREDYDSDKSDERVEAIRQRQAEIRTKKKQEMHSQDEGDEDDWFWDSENDAVQQNQEKTTCTEAENKNNNLIALESETTTNHDSNEGDSSEGDSSVLEREESSYEEKHEWDRSEGENNDSDDEAWFWEGNSNVREQRQPPKIHISSHESKRHARSIFHRKDIRIQRNMDAQLKHYLESVHLSEYKQKLRDKNRRIERGSESDTIDYTSTSTLSSDTDNSATYPEDNLRKRVSATINLKSYTNSENKRISSSMNRKSISGLKRLSSMHPAMVKEDLNRARNAINDSSDSSLTSPPTPSTESSDSGEETTKYNSK